MVDYHTHTNFSQDSEAPMEAQCRAAIAMGLKQIAFTEHEDYNPDDSTSFFFKHDEYLKEIARCRALFEGQLIIRQAIEVSEPHRYPELANPVLSKYPWDFVLGSLHWLTPWINTFEPAFFTYCGDWRQSFRDYFVEMQQLARYGDFDVLAHIDYPARYGLKYFGDDYDITEYEKEIREVLKIIIDRGKGTEINTSVLRRGRKDPNPPQPVVNWYREMGGTILTIGSDSHYPEHTGQHMNTAIQMAKQAGFTQIATFEQRKVGFIDI